MAKNTINRQQLILEFLSVVFAVLFALLLNSWRENAATHSTVNKVKQTIHSEILSNDTAVRVSVEYRIALVKELMNDQHLVFTQPVADYPIDVNDDQELEAYLEKIAPFMLSIPINRLEVKSLNDERILVLNEQTLKMKLVNDTLKFYGISNLMLRPADVSNRSWEIARATGTLVEMDLQLVDALNKVFNLNNRYLDTSDKAIDMIYRGEATVVSVLQDMITFENQILKADSVVLSLLDL